jgi:GDP-D-mannose dehydratase
MKRALITGVTGQDGSYLAELLLAKGYEVHGIKRRSSSFNTDRLEGIYQDSHQAGTHLFLHYADLSDASSLWTLLYDLQPDEVYNLAAQSHVRVSFDIPEYTSDITACGALRILEAIRKTGVRTRFYQASSSDHVEIEPRYFRPAEVDHLVADVRKAELRLGWRPRTGFRELVRIMVQAELAALEGRLEAVGAP